MARRPTGPGREKAAKPAAEHRIGGKNYSIKKSAEGDGGRAMRGSDDTVLLLAGAMEAPLCLDP